MRLKGGCEGLTGAFVDLTECRQLSYGPDPAEPVMIAALAGDYARDKEAADEKYEGKLVYIPDARVARWDEGDKALYLAVSAKKGPPVQVKVGVDDGWEDWFKRPAVGSPVRVRGTCAGLQDGKVVIEKAWPVPEK